MKRCLVVPIAIAGLASLAAPAGAAAKPKKQKTITIEARSELVQAHVVDNAPAGLGVGDVVIFTERLLDSRGKTIGSDAATCTRLFDETSLCTATFKLPGGRLMVQLLQPGPTGTYDQAITGGTGRFAGARGTVTVAQSTSGDHFTFKVRL